MPLLLQRLPAQHLSVHVQIEHVFKPKATAAPEAALLPNPIPGKDALVDFDGDACLELELFEDVLATTLPCSSQAPLELCQMKAQ